MNNNIVSFVQMTKCEWVYDQWVLHFFQEQKVYIFISRSVICHHACYAYMVKVIGVKIDIFGVLIPVCMSV